MSITYDTSKMEAIADTLESPIANAIGKWTKCQWVKKMGQLQLINLKGLATADIRDAVDGAEARIQNLLDNLEENGYRHGVVMSLADAAEWQRHGSVAIDYLADVESRADQADYVASAMLESLKIGEIEKVETQATELLRLESVRPSGKFVWKSLAHDILELVKAIHMDWVPKWKLGEQVIGNHADDSREDQCYTPREWGRLHDGMEVSTPHWVRNPHDDTFQWYEHGIVYTGEVEAI